MYAPDLVSLLFVAVDGAPLPPSRHERGRLRTDGGEADPFADERFVGQVLDVVEGVAYVADAGGRVRAYNDELAAATDRDPDALGGVDVAALFDPADRDAVTAAVDEAVETGEATTVAALTTPEGPVTHDFTLTRLTAPDGSVAGVVAAGNPLAPGEHVEVDEDLSFPSRTHILEQIFEQVPVSLYVKDREGRHLLMSAEHASRSVATGKTDPEHFGDALSRDTLADDREVVETGEPIHNVEEYNAADDVWVLTSKVPWYDEDGEIGGLIGVTRHITEKKEYEQALERENERLERLAGLISHDLRNPLTVARGRLDLIADEVDSEHVETMEDALDRMAVIVDDVLTLARQGRTVDDPEPVGLVATAREAWATADTGDATLETGGDARFLADRSRLVELFGNLFRNAVEHAAGAGSGEPSAADAPDDRAGSVTVRVEAIDGGFAVADDGPGIPPEDREAVFEPGFTTAEGGTGLGLAIVREIAEAHGWAVTVTDGTDGGARFEVTGVEPAE